MTAAAAIEMKQVTVELSGAPLFSGLTLSVPVGAKATLAGPSGSGKSTLLRCILGFVPWTAGAVRIQGKALTARSVWTLRGRLAYVAQEPELGDGRVCDALKQPFAYRINRHLQFEREAALQLMEQFLLPPSFYEKPLTELSGGEKQRVALVSALLLNRPILLLDEAASALDRAAKQAVRAYLCQMPDTTILSVSHDTRDFALSGPVLDIADLTGGRFL